MNYKDLVDILNYTSAEPSANDIERYKERIAAKEKAILDRKIKREREGR